MFAQPVEGSIHQRSNHSYTHARMLNMATLRQLFSMGFLVALGMLQPAPSQAWNHDHEAHFNPAKSAARFSAEDALQRMDLVPQAVQSTSSHRWAYRRRHRADKPGSHGVAYPRRQWGLQMQTPGLHPLVLLSKPWKCCDRRAT